MSINAYLFIGLFKKQLQSFYYAKKSTRRKLDL